MKKEPKFGCFGISMALLFLIALVVEVFIYKSVPEGQKWLYWLMLFKGS